MNDIPSNELFMNVDIVIIIHEYGPHHRSDKSIIMKIIINIIVDINNNNDNNSNSNHNNLIIRTTWTVVQRQPSK